MTSEQRKFFVGLDSKDGVPSGHALSFVPVNFNNEKRQQNATKASENTSPVERPEATFQSVFDAFVANLEGYRRFIPLTLDIAPQIARAVAEREIFDYVKAHGAIRSDLSEGFVETYELDIRFLREFWSRSGRVDAAMEGAKLLPPIMIVGLISCYDSFLASLLKVVFTLRQELVLTSQKQLTFKELLEFSSIDAARTVLIEREIETVLRKSHHEQFDWMQSHLDLKLKEGLDVWPRFVELCERRNLFTHTGGFVSEQYLKNCREHKHPVPDVVVGQKLAVSGPYFKQAVETIYEVGLKLSYVLWRKFHGDETDRADSAFNERCMELITGRSYSLAEALLKFSHRVPRVKDETRRMMIVNLANSVKLQNRGDEADKLLTGEDWSATKDDFRICVAAVRSDFDDLLSLMERAGKVFEPANYRAWPVFRSVRSDERFIQKFESIYGEPFLLASGEADDERLIEVAVDSEVSAVH